MHPASESERTVNLGDHAVEDLRFIRSTMERAGAFTAVPGWGGVGMGATGLAAAFLAAGQPTTGRWLAVWLGAALVAAGIGLWTMVRKARRLEVPLATGAGRKFVLGLLPPILVGGLLTAAIFEADAAPLVPAVWLLLYGTGIVAAGAFSVPVVPLQGLAFLILGVAALLVPEAGDLLLGLGFGVVNLVSGLVIAVRHGG